MLLTTALLLILAFQVRGHSYHLGHCPHVKPMDNFDFKQFEGVWYVIEKTATGMSCIVNNFTEAEKTGSYVLEQTSEHFLLGLCGKSHQFRYNGDLSFPNEKIKSQMAVKFPISGLMGGAIYTVFSTDYATYAGMFACQNLAFAHRRSISIMSRTKTLDKAIIDNLRNQISSFGIGVAGLETIRQEHCTEYGDDKNAVKIDQKDFNNYHTVDVFRSAGKKIEEGLDSIADTAKKFFGGYRGDHGTEDEPEDEKGDIQDFHQKNMKADAEWLP